ncbi:MAG: methylated-DNA--[protein]-cysteine S-methyltransferase [Proteobacteria bacterium]|nr:methylated-DNA--[protein]-cysteine S-methyltransferase [Pseudomonadota bacterium]
MNTPAYQAVINISNLKSGFALGLRCDADEILAVDFLTPRAAVTPKTPLAQEAVRQLRAYLKDPAFEFGLPLAPAGTHFQRRVWEGIAAIPSGETLSYGALAKSINSAPRAVGGACGANPYAVVVPCHRVVASGGGLGGFGHERAGFSLEIKRWLLAHEDARWQ